MFEISVETQFAAAHAILIGGEREPVHGHNWHVTVTLGGPSLDRDGLACDFHPVESALGDIVGAWHNRNLNEVPPFSTGVNPTAENVAKRVADELVRMLTGRLPAGVRVASVRITEAPGCTATYKPSA